MEDRVGRNCPECADWPAEVRLRIVEEVVEAGDPLPPAEAPRPIEYGPCPCCRRVLRPRIVHIEED